jgi:hypothetical protein
VESVLPLQITKLVSSGKCGKIITYGFEWAFHYQFFAAGAPLSYISHIFWLTPLKPFFLRFDEQVPFNFKNKISAVQWKWKTSQFTLIYYPC